MTTCCVPWPVVWPCGDRPTLSDEQRAAVISAATSILWARTGRRLGLCSITEGFTPRAGGDCGMPYLDDDRVWHNGGRGGSCCALWLSQRPVQAVTEVKVLGVVQDPSSYRLDSDTRLSRVGSCWPAAADCDVPPIEVTYTWGVPLNGELWGLAALAMGELAAELSLAVCGQACRLPSRVTSLTRLGVTMQLAGAVDLGEGLLGLELCDSLILTVNPNKLQSASRVYSPDMPRASRIATGVPPAQTNVGGVSTVTLPTAYEGDPYQFSLTFPDASYLAGSPADVVAQVKVDPSDVVPAATFVASVVGATLTLTLDPNPLVAGDYWTDVQVGSVTYLRKTRLTVAAQVSV